MSSSMSSSRQRPVGDPHRRYYDVLEYGDADGYRARLDEFRKRLQDDMQQEPA